MTTLTGMSMAKMTRSEGPFGWNKSGRRASKLPQLSWRPCMQRIGGVLDGVALELLRHSFPVGIRVVILDTHGYLDKSLIDKWLPARKELVLEGIGIFISSMV